MKKKPLHHLVLAVIMLASAGLAVMAGPALAQPPRWKPTLESVIVSAKANKNYRVILSNTRLGEAFIVSASIEVPYSDLDLAKDPDAAELGRRIHVAAHLVCREMDLKYPPTQYPILEGFDCEHDAAREGMDRADLVIASAKR